MTVKYQGVLSTTRALIGGGPQGTLLGGIEYNVANSDCCQDIEEEDKFKYYDDLNIIELVALAEKVIDYDFSKHIPSDVAVGNSFLPNNSYRMQDTLNNISSWTSENKMLLNEGKSNYIFVTRTKLDFDTSLTLNTNILERKYSTKL